MIIAARKHFITQASKNTAEALTMAMELWSSDQRGFRDGTQELVELINAAAIKLRNLVETRGYEIEEKATQQKELK